MEITSCLIGKLIFSMAIFNGYVKLPEYIDVFMDYNWRYPDGNLDIEITPISSKNSVLECIFFVSGQ